MDFSSWKIEKIEYVSDWGIDTGRLRFNFEDEVFEIYLGTKPRTWEGFSFTEADMPMIKAHEEAHAKLLIEGIDKAPLRYFLVVGDFDAERRRKLTIIENEIHAWKRALQELKAEDNKDWFEKAQALLNNYVFNLLW